MNYITMTLPEQLDDTVTGEAGERSLYAHFQSVTDYRKLRGQRYEAAVVLTLLVLAKITGEKKISGIAHWVKLRGGWLCEKLQAKHGHLPCLNTYRYVLMHVDEEELDREISAFMAEQCVGEEENCATADEGEGEIENNPCLEVSDSAASRAEPAQIVIDDKVLRGTDRQTPLAQAPQLVVSAYHVQQRRVLTQQAALSRGKEKQSALAILEHLPMAGHLISVDALHTSPNWCQQVRCRQGHYLLIAKRNRQELYEDIALLFTHTPLSALPEQRAQTVDKGHGRLEIRRLRVSSALSDYLKPD